jgi:hypothetical protein
MTLRTRHMGVSLLSIPEGRERLHAPLAAETRPPVRPHLDPLNVTRYVAGRKVQ